MQLRFKLQFILLTLDREIAIQTRLVTGWPKRDTTLQENITFTNKRKPLSYSHPEGTLE